MDNLKIRVTSEAESKEAQELFFKLSYGFEGCMVKPVQNFEYVSERYFFAYSDGDLTVSADESLFNFKDSHKEITLQQLRDLVVLKRGDRKDATHVGIDNNLPYLVLSDGDIKVMYDDGWKKSYLTIDKLNPIEKEMKESKEYLDTDNEYALITAHVEIPKDTNWIEVPRGRNFAFKKKNGDFRFSELPHVLAEEERIWQRNPETVKITIDELKERVKDNVNNPIHYNSGGIECIDAMEAMLTPEQFIGYLRGNCFKYQWRYDQKGGIEDLKKAQWYLNKLIEKESGNE